LETIYSKQSDFVKKLKSTLSDKENVEKTGFNNYINKNDNNEKWKNYEI